MGEQAGVGRKKFVGCDKGAGNEENFIPIKIPLARVNERQSILGGLEDGHGPTRLGGLIFSDEILGIVGTRRDITVGGIVHVERRVGDVSVLLILHRRIDAEEDHRRLAPV